MKFTRKGFINTLLGMIFGFRKPFEQVTPVVTKVNLIKEPVMAKLAVPAYFATSGGIFPFATSGVPDVFAFMNELHRPVMQINNCDFWNNRVKIK